MRQRLSGAAAAYSKPAPVAASSQSWSFIMFGRLKKRNEQSVVKTGGVPMFGGEPVEIVGERYRQDNIAALVIIPFQPDQIWCH